MNFLLCAGISLNVPTPRTLFVWIIVNDNVRVILFNEDVLVMLFGRKISGSLCVMSRDIIGVHLKCFLYIGQRV